MTSTEPLNCGKQRALLGASANSGNQTNGEEYGGCGRSNYKHQFTRYVTNIFVWILTFGVCVALIASGANLPRFEDYPAAEIFKGSPAAPKLRRPGDRLFRTKIREGAAKGPNFAGHFTIADWGCGAGCVSIAIVDAKNGTIYGAPFTALEWGMPLLKYEGKYAPSEPGFAPLTYKLESRLLIVRGCPEEENCGSYFYDWTGTHFKLIRKVTALRVSE